MVGLLAERGDLAGAIELETLWHEVLRRQPLRLLCGYPRGVVGDIYLAFDEICATHDGVLVSCGPGATVPQRHSGPPARPDSPGRRAPSHP